MANRTNDTTEGTSRGANIRYRFATIALAVVLILLVPLIAMQFTTEVVWTLADFVVAGGLLGGTGFAYVLITRKMDKKHRIFTGLVLLAVLLLVWIELAVGLFGTPWAGS